MAKLKNVGLWNFVIGRIAQSKHKQSICYLYESASESLDVKNVGKAKSEKSDKMQKNVVRWCNNWTQQMCQKRLSRGTKYYGELGYGGPAIVVSRKGRR